MDRDISKQIAAIVEDYEQKLRETLETLRNECPKAEFKRYARGIAEILKYLDDDILAPIYKEHPDLRPIDTRSGTQ
jgi:hypothetical protein